jgi:hypothetical protein
MGLDIVTKGNYTIDVLIQIFLTHDHLCDVSWCEYVNSVAKYTPDTYFFCGSLRNQWKNRIRFFSFGSICRITVGPDYLFNPCFAGTNTLSFSAKFFRIFRRPIRLQCYLKSNTFGKLPK